MEYKAVHTGWTEDRYDHAADSAMKQVNEACKEGGWRLWGFRGTYAILERQNITSDWIEKVIINEFEEGEKGKRSRLSQIDLTRGA